jgi:hypothetical protein
MQGNIQGTFREHWDYRCKGFQLSFHGRAMLVGMGDVNGKQKILPAAERGVFRH